MTVAGRKTTTRAVGLIVTGATLFFTMAACSTSTDTTGGAKVTSGTTGSAAQKSTASGAAADVKVTGCANGDLGGPSATLVVTNHSSKPSNYIIEVSFESKDGKTQYGTGDASVDSLNPGQASAPQTADSLTTTAAPKGFTCRVSDVTRYAS